MKLTISLLSLICFAFAVPLPDSKLPPGIADFLSGANDDFLLNGGGDVPENAFGALIEATESSGAANDVLPSLGGSK